MTPLLDIPVLETERLVLRGPAPEDEARYVAFMMSERAGYLAGERRALLGAWEAFAAEFGHWATRGFGMWAVCDRRTGENFGFVGLWRPAGWPESEVGWTLWAEAEGRGIAFEAALAARAHAYDRLGWTTAVSYIDPDNLRSIRLAERLGARRDPDAAIPPDSEPCLVYRHPAPGAAS